MRVLLLDLDLTLVNTSACQAYMRSSAGRQAVLEEIASGRIGLPVYDTRLPAYINVLAETPNLAVAIVSDSPAEYCAHVLRQAGYNIDNRLIFGSQSKPITNILNLRTQISALFAFANIEFLVVGDSPKDIYMAHALGVPSILAAWGSRHDIDVVTRWSRPTVVARTFEELQSHITNFLNGHMSHTAYAFDSDYHTIDINVVDRIHVPPENIGHGQEYVPDRTQYRNNTDRYASLDLRSIVKRAKDLPISHHNAKRGVPSFGVNGLYQTAPLMSKAGHYKRSFVEWCRSRNIQGKILLVPVPSSVPRECNLTYTMDLICDWWKLWINGNEAGLNIEVCSSFERFWPRSPSHLTGGRRDMDDHFDTLGIFKGTDSIDDVNHVVIVDDVVTSGSHIDAMATFIRAVGLVPATAVIHGYALYRTVHPEAVDLGDF